MKVSHTQTTAHPPTIADVFNAAAQGAAQLFAPKGIFAGTVELASLKSEMLTAREDAVYQYEQFLMCEVARMEGEIAVYDATLEKLEGKVSTKRLSKELSAARADDLAYWRELKAAQKSEDIDDELWALFADDEEFGHHYKAFEEAQEAYEVALAQTNPNGATA